MCANYAPTRPDRLLAVFGVSPARDDYVEDAYPGHVTPIIVAGDTARRAELASRPDEVRAVLADGAVRARAVAQKTLQRAKANCGLG